MSDSDTFVSVSSTDPRLRTHRFNLKVAADAPLRPLRMSLPRFFVVGALSVGTDVGCLTVLHSVLHFPLIAATTLAYGLGLLVNYSLNHTWVFAADGRLGDRLMRYGILVAINFSSTLGLIAGLTAVGLYYLIAKAVAVAVNAVINFVAFRYWVFR